jgi:hypothetical protein
MSVVSMASGFTRTRTRTRTAEAAEASAQSQSPPCALITVSAWLESMHTPHPPPRNKRDFMKLAYRQQYRCAHCDELMHPDAQTDHIVPWCLVPDDSDSNVQILCPNCHVTKTHDEAGRIRRVKDVLCRIQAGKMDKLEGVCWRCLQVCSVYFVHQGCSLSRA